MCTRRSGMEAKLYCGTMLVTVYLEDDVSCEKLRCRVVETITSRYGLSSSCQTKRYTLCIFIPQQLTCVSYKLAITFIYIFLYMFFMQWQILLLLYKPITCMHYQLLEALENAYKFMNIQAIAVLGFEVYGSTTGAHFLFKK